MLCVVNWGGGGGGRLQRYCEARSLRDLSTIMLAFFTEMFVDIFHLNLSFSIRGLLGVSKW